MAHGALNTAVGGLLIVALYMTSVALLLWAIGLYVAAHILMAVYRRAHFFLSLDELAYDQAQATGRWPWWSL